ncbi:efflux RND transporter permease subunit [Halobacteriovorax sp. HLS]|uniref:efflux RND transporter permease subunit n=1 Tax=Halobacteriovorax sp. HLS TaxID=2234000 RepID=UPI000FDB089E|nr:efflux RND transporter permease subunit [Halobacteriovorax sp. HLS]
MKGGLTEFALKKQTITLTFVAIVFLTGIMSLRNIPQAEDPGFVVRTALVMTSFPGASPERVEQLVTNTIEEKIQEMPELKHIESQSKTGISVVTITIKDQYKEMRPIWDKLRRKVDDATKDLPEGALAPYVNDDFGDVFGSVITITGNGYSYRELRDFADDLKDEILKLKHTGRVEKYGFQDEKIYLEYNQAKLSELELSPVQLGSLLQEQNILQSGGTIYTNSDSITIEPTGNFLNVQEIKDTIIQLPNSKRLVYLKDILNIRRGYIDPPKQMVRANGAVALALGVSLREGGNIVAQGEELTLLLERMRNILPLGIELEMPVYQPEVVDKKVSDFLSNLYQSIVIVFLSMLVFLGARTGAIVASLIPAAILFSLFWMDFLEYTLDQITLASLIIALGMLVDNAIVMVESITVQVQEGKKLLNACIDSANELKVSLLTSSLTTSAAFLPISTAKNQTGEYLAPMAVVVTITLLCSWILSLTMIPLFSYKFLKVEASAEDENVYAGPFYTKYVSLLKKALEYRKTVVAILVASFAFSLFLLGFIPKNFMPENDRPILIIKIETPKNTPIKRTAEIIEGIEGYLNESWLVNEKREMGALNWVGVVGGGDPRFSLTHNPVQAEPYSGVLLAKLSHLDWDFYEKIRTETYDFIVKNYPEVTAKVEGLKSGGGSKNPLEVRFIGTDSDRLKENSKELKSILETTPGLRSSGDDWGIMKRKVIIDIDKARAFRAGVTNQDIATSLQSVFDGTPVSEYREGKFSITMLLRSSNANRNDLSKLETMDIFSQRTGASIPLKQVAEIKLVWEDGVIYRRNRLRTLTLYAASGGANLAKVIKEKVQPWLDENSPKWGYGYSYEFGGEKESSSQATEAIASQLPLAGIIIILLLILQFNSYKKVSIIMLTIPLGFIGVVIGLFITRGSFGFMSLLGLISLAGIVINNAIVLIDRIDIERDRFGREPYDAVIEAGMRRLRPILMTTVSTIVGLLPLWFFGGVLWTDMAVSIIFGLLVSTILTLIFVPVLYSFLFKIDTQRV